MTGISKVIPSVIKCQDGRVGGAKSGKLKAES
jgi:hypothetical protein